MLLWLHQLPRNPLLASAVLLLHDKIHNKKAAPAEKATT
jgi:hypothetical protein